MEGKGDFLRLTEKEGEKVINTSEFNLHKWGSLRGQYLDCGRQEVHLGQPRQQSKRLHRLERFL